MCHRNVDLRAAALALAAAAVLGSGCSGDAVAERGEPRTFTDVTQQAGITHRHHKPVLDSQLAPIMSWMASVGAAVAAGDADNDGWIDLYVTDSRQGEPNYLYMNQGDGTFTEVGAQAGVADLNGEHGTSMDAVWGDFDNDGWVDLYVVRWGRDVLLRNNGRGADGRLSFTDVSEQHFRRRGGEPGIDWANGNAAIFFDFDLDGRLDIYVGNYFAEVDLWNLEDTRIMHDDFERARNGGHNFLYHQQDDGSFVEVATDLGLDDPGWTLAVGAGDLDDNGWPDLYCADDFGPDQLFLNRGGSFANVSDTAIGFDSKKGMNVDFGDFDNDGWLDVYVTNITTAEYLQEGNMLWYNQGLGDDGELKMIDIALESGTYDGGWGWGAKFFDYDNDGDLDIVSANGFISAGEGSYWYDLASWTVTGIDSADARNWPPIGERSFSGYERLRLWRNDGLYSFTEQAKNAGLESISDGRGIAVVDYDNDGDLDVFVANQDAEPNLYRNDHGAPGHWLTVTLEIDPATGVNRDAVGSRLTAVTSGTLRIRERDGGNGYSGQSDPRVHFGLGDAVRLDLLEVRWPDGGLQYLEDVEVDQAITVRQDPARYASKVAVAVATSSYEQPEQEKAPAPPAIEPSELDRQLADMERRLRSAPFERNLASAYRLRAATYDQHDRAVAYLEELVEARGEPNLRIELALAYIDRIPACGGLAAIVCKGSMAKKGLDQLDLVLEEHPDSWLATYCRGMNHLHWPRALLHSEDAAGDLERAVEIQSRGGVVSPYHRRTYLALGQAWAKAGRYQEGRQAWRRGLELFPQDAELQAHLAIDSDEELLDYVLEQRSLEQTIDTGLEFYTEEL